MQRVLKGGLAKYMISMGEAEKIISECLDSNRLKRIIRNTSVVAWQKKYLMYR